MRDPSFNTPTALPLADRAGALLWSNLVDPLSVKFENIIVDYRGSTLSDPASFSDTAWLCARWPGRYIVSSDRYVLMKNIYGIKHDGTYFTNQTTEVKAYTNSSSHKE